MSESGVGLLMPATRQKARAVTSGALTHRELAFQLKAYCAAEAQTRLAPISVRPVTGVCP
jgi:hypothetical protein